MAVHTQQQDQGSQQLCFRNKFIVLTDFQAWLSIFEGNHKDFVALWYLYSQVIGITVLVKFDSIDSLHLGIVVWMVYCPLLPFLCYPCLLSAINMQFDLTTDCLLFIWQWYGHYHIYCHLQAVALANPVTFSDLWLCKLRWSGPSLAFSVHCVTLHTRLPPLFNIKNVGEGLGTRLTKLHI